MIDEVIQILRDIGQFFKDIAEFVIGLFRDLIYLVKVLDIVPFFIDQFLDIFPSVIINLISCFISIAVIYKVFNR